MLSLFAKAKIQKNKADEVNRMLLIVNQMLRSETLYSPVFPSVHIGGFRDKKRCRMKIAERYHVVCLVYNTKLCDRKRKEIYDG